MASLEIDFSKENIQPLKEGRLASYLGTALTAQCNAKSQNEILKAREKFELELRKYKGDDPLEVWYNYISWVIQAYPSNEVSDLTTLIHKCLAKFKDEARYHQDVRYVKLWIKYIEMQRDPFETYDMIHKHGIGSKCAQFYKSWAEEYEKAGNFKQASFIYAKGFEYGAQPASELAQAQRNFEDRVARHFATKSEDDWMESNEGSEQRRALSALASTRQGRSENVGSVRTGAAIIGSAGVLKSQNVLQKQRKPVEVPIYMDHHATDSRKSVHLENLPTARGYNQENIKKPGKWTNGSSKRAAPPITSTPMSSIPFKMHEDHSSEKGIATPGGLRYSQNVFKVRKVEKDDFDCPLAIFEPPDPKKVVMYCKEKVYSGGTEFSLEEIRAIKYMEAGEKMQKELLKENDDNFEEKCGGGSSQALNIMDKNPMTTPSNNIVTPKNVEQYGSQIEGFQEERQIGSNMYNQSPIPQFDFLSATSPTINTRAANAMMNELFSSTFTQCFGDSLLAMPQQSQPSVPKFEIPCDDNAAFPDIPDQEDKIAPQIPKAPQFTIHCNENMLFPETPLNDGNNWKTNGSQEVASDWGAHIPFVPPPKDEVNYGDDDSSKENHSPQDYQLPATKEKRPLAGILLPSKSVPFKPLGEDEEGEVAEGGGGTAKVVAQVDYTADKAGENNAVGNAMGPLPCHQKTWETSFESEMLGCLNDVSKVEIPVRSKDERHNNEASFLCKNTYKTVPSFFSQKSNGGVLIKQSSKLNTIETQINTGSINDYGCIFQQFPMAPVSGPLRSDNNSKGMFGKRNLWDEGHSTQQLEQKFPIAPLSGPLRSDNNDKAMFGNRNLWVEGHSAQQLDGLNGNFITETVENPMETSMLEDLLGKVALPVHRSSNFYRITQGIPYLKSNDVLNLRKGLKLIIQRVIGRTADAKFFLAVNAEGELIVIKYQHISCEWEFYIAREIRNRLEDSLMFPAFSNILEGHLFNADSSMLLMKYLPNGTFLDLLNMYKKRFIGFPEVLVLFFTIDLVNSVRHLHGCNIIHGSIRPENLLVGDIPNVPSSSWNEEQFKGLLPILQLMNMGKCIDMTLFPRNVCFTSTSAEDQYQCIEMQNGKPWTYQTDFYGIAFTMHCMIFGEFMDISCQNKIWNINRKLPSHFNSGIWNNLFHSLLNVPSCDFLPNLHFIQYKLQEFMFTFEVNEFVSSIARMKTMLEEEHKRASNKIRAFKYV